jgi:hypothetical protein
LPTRVNLLWASAQRFATEEGEDFPQPVHVENAAAMLQPRVKVRRTSVDRSPVRSRRDAVRRSPFVRNVSARVAIAAVLAVLWIAPISDGVVDRINDGLPAIELSERIVEAIAISPQQQVETEVAESAASPVPSPPRAVRTQVAQPRVRENPPKTIPDPTPVLEALRRYAELAPQSSKTLSLPQPDPLAAEGARLQLASMSIEAVAEEPDCQPYVADVDFTLRKASVRGLACRDSAGIWWLVDQQTGGTG